MTKFRTISLAIGFLMASHVSSLRAAPSPVVVPVYGKAADNKIYAQRLVNELLATHPELFSIGLHAIPPGKTAYEIVAQTRDLIGKKSSPANVEIITNNQITITPTVVAGASRCVVDAVLCDKAGEPIALVALTFTSGPSVTKFTALALAEPILDWLAEKVPTRAALFKPEP